MKHTDKKPAKKAPVKKATTMTDETTVINPAAQAEKEDNRTAKEIAADITKQSRHGDPYEFSDVDKGREIYSHLDPDKFQLREGDGLVRIEKV